MVSNHFGIHQLKLQYLLLVNLRSKTIFLQQNCFFYSKFVQICASFDPKSGTSQEQDKCHHLRNASNHLNKAVKRTFIPGKEMSFNEGGI